MTTSAIVSKVWSYCNVLRDDGVGYGDYLEQLTYLLFLKMADEYGKPPYNRKIGIPKELNWESLVSKRRGRTGNTLHQSTPRTWHSRKGWSDRYLPRSQNKIQDPAKLFKIIEMIDSENWVMHGADVKGDIYEGLLEKNAEDTKSGAGQYFTPRALNPGNGRMHHYLNPRRLLPILPVAPAVFSWLLTITWCKQQPG